MEAITLLVLTAGVAWRSSPIPGRKLNPARPDTPELTAPILV
jgi:hypothetical protein